MSRTIVAVLYVKGEQMMNNVIMDFNALDDMIGEELRLPVKHGTDIIGYCIKLEKQNDKIYATIELIGEIGYLLQQKGKRYGIGDIIVINDARLSEIYI